MTTYTRYEIPYGARTIDYVPPVEHIAPTAISVQLVTLLTDLWLNHLQFNGWHFTIFPLFPKPAIPKGFGLESPLEISDIAILNATSELYTL